jgi:DNA modification methylase
MNQLRLETVLISSLSLDLSNARKHDAKNLASIAGSLKLFGQRKPIVVSGANVVVAGNGTLEAAKSLGWSEIDVVRIPADWSAEQVKAYALADNRTAELAEWDAKILAEQLVELDAVGWDVSEFGFEPMNPAGDLDDNEPLSFDEDKPTRSKLGDLWQVGEHRILCGDSMQIKDLEKVLNSNLIDMVFADPPYGYKYESNYYKNGNPFGELKNDDVILNYIENILQFVKEDSAIYSCAGHQNQHLWRDIFDKRLKYKNTIIWKKNNWSMGDLDGSYAGQYEMIFFYTKGRHLLRNGRQRDVWEFDREPPKNHPTQKPTELVEFAITNSTDKNQIVFDPFSGSGSTLVACARTKRIGYGIELDPKYVDVILDRLEKETGLEASRLEQ